MLYGIQKVPQPLEFSETILVLGTPTRLITDRGSCFTSSIFKSFMESTNVKHILNAVATPRANRQIERYNRTLLDALGTIRVITLGMNMLVTFS